MSSETYVPKVRKATFTVEKVKNRRIFRAVNKRALKLAKRVGKRTILTTPELKKALNGRTHIQVWAYVDGTLTRVRV